MKIVKYLLFIIIINSCNTNQPNEVINSITPVYSEPHRPQFHFTPEEKWMNDPNGMVFYEGEYHLFYQYYPEDIVWGPMHWGHAVSPDMISWKHLPIALFPDSLGLIFSGSAVIDKNNTAGFGKDAMVAIFTHHNMEGEKNGDINFQQQSIAYSLDKGRTFTKYQDNPVIKNPGIKDFRDPKVIWHQASNKWVMVFAAYDKVLFYNSDDLKNWTKTGEFGIEGDERLWECPDLFHLKIENSDEVKWILITSIQKNAPNGGTATSYFVGNFDGKTFVGDPENQKWMDFGKDNYAFVTWSNISDGRILGLGWMSNWQYAQKVPTQTWRSAMTLPRELKLTKHNNDFILKSKPVKEMNNYLKNTSIIESKTIFGSEILVSDTIKTLHYLKLKLKKPLSNSFSIVFSNELDEKMSVGYDPILKSYFIDRTQSGISDFSEDFAGIHVAPVQDESENVDIEIFLDVSSIEIFADNGKTVMTEIMFPSKPYSTITLKSETVKLELLSGSISEISRIWE